jgi:hypothetical protein
MIRNGARRKFSRRGKNPCRLWKMSSAFWLEAEVGIALLHSGGDTPCTGQQRPPMRIATLIATVSAIELKPATDAVLVHFDQ